MKLDARFVKEQADLYLEKDLTRRSVIYRNAIEKAMKPSFSNFWLGRSEEKAVRWLNITKGDIFGNYFENLSWPGSYWRNVVEDVSKAAKLSIEHGDGLIWINEENLFFLEN